MSEDRLIEIESKLAHVEMLVEELNQVLAQQQDTIARLEKAVQIMARTSTDPNNKPKPINQIPPHY